MNPTPGRIVLYTLSQDDANTINKRRLDFAKHRQTSPNYEDTGYVAHVGNTVRAGSQFPAVVIQVWEPAASANLHVLLDGADTFWATSVAEGTGQRRWVWPPRA